MKKVCRYGLFTIIFFLMYDQSEDKFVNVKSWPSLSSSHYNKQNDSGKHNYALSLLVLRFHTSGIRRKSRTKHIVGLKSTEENVWM